MTALQEETGRESLPDRIQADRAEHASAETERVPGHAVLTVIGAACFAIGWVIGAIVSVIGFMAGAGRYGYRQGRLVIPPPPRTPSQPQPAQAASRALPHRESRGRRESREYGDWQVRQHPALAAHHRGQAVPAARRPRTRLEADRGTLGP